MVLGKLYRYMQKNETRPPSYATKRINLKCTKDLNVRSKTIKILEENIGNKILDISHFSIFSDISPWPRETKEKINKWDYIKLKVFAQQRKLSK